MGTLLNIEILSSPDDDHLVLQQRHLSLKALLVGVNVDADPPPPCRQKSATMSKVRSFSGETTLDF